MNEEPQEVLAAAFAHVRDMRSAGASDIVLRIAYAGGVIGGLEDTGALNLQFHNTQVSIPLNEGNKGRSA